MMITVFSCALTPDVTLFQYVSSNILPFRFVLYLFFLFFSRSLFFTVLFIVKYYFYSHPPAFFQLYPRTVWLSKTSSVQEQRNNYNDKYLPPRDFNLNKKSFYSDHIIYYFFLIKCMK